MALPAMFGAAHLAPTSPEKVQHPPSKCSRSRSSTAKAAMCKGNCSTSSISGALESTAVGLGVQEQHPSTLTPWQSGRRPQSKTTAPALVGSSPSMYRLGTCRSFGTAGLGDPKTQGMTVYIALLRSTPVALLFLPNSAMFKVAELGADALSSRPRCRLPVWWHNVPACSRSIFSC